jgi:asparagine synthase (glutamine-hydrolysing)
MNRTFAAARPDRGSYLLPGADSLAFELEKVIATALTSGQYRVILSGIGGDEVLGGVPTPYPELANLLVAGRLGRLNLQAIAWSLERRVPLLYTLFRTATYTYGLYRGKDSDSQEIPFWICSRLRLLSKELSRTSAIEDRRFGRMPSSIANGIAWWSILETLPSLFPKIVSNPEYRYPYLDRDLVDFLFSIPRDQLVRPGRRRSLMRRALKGIVPDAILERRRKAFLMTGPLTSMQREKETIGRLFKTSTVAALGFVNADALKSALDLTTSGAAPQYWPSLCRVIDLDLWLRSNSRVRNMS